MLLRVFCGNGRHNQLSEYAKGNTPLKELQIYSWFVTLTTMGIVRFIMCMYACYFREHRSYISENQKCKKMMFVDFDIFHWMASLEYCIPWPSPTFWNSKIWNVKIAEMVRLGKKNAGEYLCRFQYLPSRDNIVKIVLCDQDLHLKIKNLKNWHLWKN